jgi:hypothetical protein
MNWFRSATIVKRSAFEGVFLPCRVEGYIQQGTEGGAGRHGSTVRGAVETRTSLASLAASTSRVPNPGKLRTWLIRWLSLGEETTHAKNRPSSKAVRP